MSRSIDNDNKSTGGSKYIKVIVSSDLLDTKTFMMKVNSKISFLKKEILDRCGSEDMEIYWKGLCSRSLLTIPLFFFFASYNKFLCCPFYRQITDKDERIDIKVDGDLAAFLAKGNDKIFVDPPKIRTENDFALEQEYAEYVEYNKFF